MFCGLLIFAGELIVIAGGPEIVTAELGLGPFFGPHVAFCAGTVAAAYAYSRGKLETGLDIITPLVKLGAWDVLFIGGIFGVFGYALNQVFFAMNIPTDTLALTIVVLQIVGRTIWGKTGVFGDFDPEGKNYKSRWDSRATKEAAWVPFQRPFGMIFMLGLGVGLASGYMSLVTGSEVIGFGFTAFSLILLQTMGIGPVTHHIALTSALATIATGSLITGGVFGIIAAFVGCLLSRVFNDWGDTHIDPPACSIMVVSSIVILIL